MEYKELNSGQKMPMVGFGTWNLHGLLCEQAVQEAVACGYRLIDTAQMYGNECEVGRGLRQAGIAREEIFLTTKIDQQYHSYSLAKASIQESLERLQVDYLDLLLLHEPYDESLEMYQAMKESREKGQVRSIGVSNFNASLYQKFCQVCGIIPAVNQVEAHVFHGQRNLQRVLEKKGTCMEAWSPFAAGKMDVFHHPVLQKIGRELGKTSAQIALRYLVQRGIVVIPKSAHRARMRENLEIFDFQLGDADIQAIETLDTGISLFGWD